MSRDELKNGLYEEYGNIIYYKNGRMHREDGPAVEYANGDKEWFLNDISYTEEEFKEAVKILHTKTPIVSGRIKAMRDSQSSSTDSKPKP